MVDKGEMKNKLQDLINSSNSMTRVELDVSLADSEYQAYIKRARETSKLLYLLILNQSIWLLKQLPGNYLASCVYYISAFNSDWIDSLREYY